MPGVSALTAEPRPLPLLSTHLSLPEIAEEMFLSRWTIKPDSHVFTAHAHYVFGDLRTWGWITLIIGVLQLLAAAGVVAGNQLARWFAVAVLALNAIDQMFFIPPTRSGR